MGALKKLTGNECSKCKNYKKLIDNYVFFSEDSRKIFFENPDGSRVTNEQVKENERPLRAMTMQGERVSIAKSETVPAGVSITFTMIVLDNSLNKALDECFDYGRYKGFGQWRNAGWGCFTWQDIS